MKFDHRKYNIIVGKTICALINNILLLEKHFSTQCFGRKKSIAPKNRFSLESIFDSHTSICDGQTRS